MNGDVLGVRVERVADGNAVVALSGEMDMANAHLCSAALEDLGGCSTVVVDMADLTYIDSSGLRVLLVFGQRLLQHGGRLVLAGMRSSVRRLFDLAGLSKIFEVVTTVEDAAT